MDNSEFYEFLKVTLIKIENAINLIKQENPKHILSYNKMLGVQQKIAQLDEEHRNCLFPQIIDTRSIISYFVNGKYHDAYNKILKLKKELVSICLKLGKNEKDKNE